MTYTTNEAKQISLRAAIRERAERLRVVESPRDFSGMHPFDISDVVGDAINEGFALRAQIRDLETELHALLQELEIK